MASVLSSYEGLPALESLLEESRKMGPTSFRDRLFWDIAMRKAPEWRRDTTSASISGKKKKKSHRKPCFSLGTHREPREEFTAKRIACVEKPPEFLRPPSRKSFFSPLTSRSHEAHLTGGASFPCKEAKGKCCRG